MADLSQAFKTYINERRRKATLHGFSTQNEANKEIITTWFETFQTYDEAYNILLRKFKKEFKSINNKTYTSNTHPDLQPLFAQAELNKSSKINGTKILRASIDNTTKKLLLKLKVPPSTNEESVASSPSPMSPSSSVIDELVKYINTSKENANKYGFNLQTEIHEVLASKGVILLKQDQVCPALSKSVDSDALLTNILAETMNNDVKLNTDTYTQLAILFRVVNSTTNRRSLKIELNRLYEEASPEDGLLIEWFVNLVHKLPGFHRLSPVGEMELTVNYLDPILSHVFHCPDSDRYLLWLNRQDENTSTFKPDAAMMAIPKRAENITLGYVEVKPSDIESDLELGFMDLACGRPLMLRKTNKKVLVVQCIGYSMIFYLLSELSPDVSLMTELLRLDVPKQISEIGLILQKVDDLKRVFHLFENHMSTSYCNTLTNEEASPVTEESINPKRRRKRNPSFSLV